MCHNRVLISKYWGLTCGRSPKFVTRAGRTTCAPPSGSNSLCVLPTKPFGTAAAAALPRQEACCAASCCLLSLSETVSRNDSNAYGMDVHIVANSRAEMMVNVLPYYGGSPEQARVMRFLQSASMSPTLSLMDARQVSAEEAARDGLKYWCFQYEHPHALVVATVAEGVLYCMTATATDSRRWNALYGEMKAATDSFRVPM